MAQKSGTLEGVVRVAFEIASERNAALDKIKEMLRVGRDSDACAEMRTFFGFRKPIARVDHDGQDSIQVG